VPTSIGRLPHEKTPHRAPPYEELDPPYDIKLVLVQKITFSLEKSTETAATRAALLDYKHTHPFNGPFLGLPR